MASFVAPRRFAVGLASALLAVAACGGAGKGQTGTTTGSGGMGGCSPEGAGPTTTLSLPQFVHGAAYVDTLGFPQIPIVVGVGGSPPAGVDVNVDGTTVHAVADGSGRFVASVAMTLAAGPHPVTASATGCGQTATTKGTLVAGAGTFQLTDFSKVGPAYDAHLWHDTTADALALSWVDVAPGTHVLHYNRFDGGFTRLLPADVTLNDAADEPLSGVTAPGPGGIGVVYRTAKPGDVHWLVKMRVVDPDGKELVPVMDLTQGQAAFSMVQAGADPGGFSAAWVHITPPTDPSNPPPLEVRFSRWDVAAKKLVGPITLDTDQPQPAGSGQGPLGIAPLAELGIACNDAVCLVSYTREVYNALVDLNVPKLSIAIVDLAAGKLAAPPLPVEATDWDTQEFGQHLVALADGSFVLVYTANDTAAAVNPKSACDDMLERDLLFAVELDKTGKKMAAPKPIFDFEGTRQYPRVAAHPAGFALFWEDQRSECNPGGHIRLAASVAAPGLKSLLDAYFEIPGSVGLPPEDPTLAVADTNVVVAYSDDRHGMGLTDPRPEINLDTYWRK